MDETPDAAAPMDEEGPATTTGDGEVRHGRAWRTKLVGGAALVAAALVCTTVGASSFDTSATVSTAVSFGDVTVVRPGGTGKVRVEEGTGTLTVTSLGAQRYRAEQLEVLDPAGRRLSGQPALQLSPDGSVGREAGAELVGGTEFATRRGGTYTVANGTTAKVQVDVSQYSSSVSDNTTGPAVLMVVGGLGAGAGLVLVVGGLKARREREGDEA